MRIFNKLNDSIGPRSVLFLFKLALIADLATPLVILVHFLTCYTNPWYWLLGLLLGLAWFVLASLSIAVLFRYLFQETPPQPTLE